MSRTLSVLMILVLAVLALAGCATPEAALMGGGGAAARDGDQSGRSARVGSQVAYGPVGGATNSHVGYERQETGTQDAPQLTLALQPGAGASVSASYPALTCVVFSPIVVMGNSQRDSTLSPEQLERMAAVAEQAGEAARKAIDASGPAAAKAAVRVAETVAPAAPAEPAK